VVSLLLVPLKRGLHINTQAPKFSLLARFLFIQTLKNFPNEPQRSLVFLVVSPFTRLRSQPQTSLLNKFSNRFSYGQSIGDRGVGPPRYYFLAPFRKRYDSGQAGLPAQKPSSASTAG